MNALATGVAGSKREEIMSKGASGVFGSLTLTAGLPKGPVKANGPWRPNLAAGAGDDTTTPYNAGCWGLSIDYMHQFIGNGEVAISHAVNCVAANDTVCYVFVPGIGRRLVWDAEPPQVVSGASADRISRNEMYSPVIRAPRPRASNSNLTGW